MANKEKLILVADGTDAVYKAGLRGATLNPVADEIIKLQRKYINESTNLLDLSSGLQDTDEDGAGLRVTKNFIEIIPSSQDYMKIEHHTNATLRDFAPSLVVGEKYKLVWKATGYMSYAYLSLLGYAPEDTAKESLVFVATEEILDGHIIAVAADIYDNGFYTEIVSSPATFYDIALYEVPEDVVADGLDERMGIIKEEVPDVYQAALNKGIEQGKQAEYDRFWDNRQEYGNRTNYSIYDGASFAGSYWTDAMFNPKYPIRPTNAQMIFRATGITDLTRDGIKLDFSKATEMQYAFSFSKSLIKLPTIDMSSSKNCTSCFSDYQGTSLSVVFGDATVVSNTTFDGMKNLVDFSIVGKVGQPFSIKASTKLNRASHESVVAALSTTTTGLTVTFSLAAVNKAFETAEGANDGSYNSIEWLDLVADRSNWNIALV